MKSEICNIKLVYKNGAFGDPNKYGRWIYGKRPDGKTVACKNERTKEGGVRIWSHWKTPTGGKKECFICETEFSKEEWVLIQQEPDEIQSLKCNQILSEREMKC